MPTHVRRADNSLFQRYEDKLRKQAVRSLGNIPENIPFNKDDINLSPRQVAPIEKQPAEVRMTAQKTSNRCLKALIGVGLFSLKAVGVCVAIIVFGVALKYALGAALGLALLELAGYGVWSQMRKPLTITVNLNDTFYASFANSSFHPEKKVPVELKKRMAIDLIGKDLHRMDIRLSGERATDAQKLYDSILASFPNEEEALRFTEFCDQAFLTHIVSKLSLDDRVKGYLVSKGIIEKDAFLMLSMGETIIDIDLPNKSVAISLPLKGYAMDDKGILTELDMSIPFHAHVDFNSRTVSMKISA